MSVVVVAQHGHVAMRRVERDGIGPGPAEQRLGSFSGDLARQRDEGTFHWVTFDLPEVLTAVEDGVVAESRSAGEFEQDGTFGRFEVGILAANRSFR